MNIETIGQLIAWVLASGAIAYGVSYVLQQFPALDEKWAKAIQSVATITLSTFVTAIANVLPQTVLDARILDVVAFVASFIANWVGILFGQLKGLEHRSKTIGTRDWLQKSVNKVDGVELQK